MGLKDATGIGATTTALAGGGLKAAGFYTAVNSTTGATMLGSTWAGTSAAGTIGFIGGTGGLIGTSAAFVMSPLVLGTATAVGGVWIGMKAYSYFYPAEAEPPEADSTQTK